MLGAVLYGTSTTKGGNALMSSIYDYA